MFWRLALIFITLPTAELFVLWLFSSMFGFFGTIITLAVILGTGLLGAALARYQGLWYWKELHRQLDRGETPTIPVLHGVLILFGAALLVVPGLITDFIGILLLIPPIRSLVINYAQLRFEAYRLKNRRSSPSPNPPPPDVIDIE